MGKAETRGRLRREQVKTRAKARASERVVGTFNAPILAYKGTNGIGHNLVFLAGVCSDIVKTGCDVMGLQETRRRGQGAVSYGKYVVMWSGVRDGTTDKVGVHGVGLAIKYALWDGVEGPSSASGRD